MFLGILFLFGSLDVAFRDRAPRVFVFLSFLLVAGGAFCTALAIRLNKSSLYLFLASFFLMTGVFLFLSALGIVPTPFSGAWPLLSVFAGLSLLPISLRRSGSFRLSYIVSSCAFVVLGTGLLIFYLKIVPFSFKYFIQAFWPLLFVLGGISLVLTSLSAKRNEGSE